MRLNINLKPQLLVLIIGMSISNIYGQYNVGETISQATRDKVVSFCTNGSGNITVGELLTPADGQAARVVWLNFFESW